MPLVIAWVSNPAQYPGASRGSIYLEDSSDVGAYAELFDHLRARALGPDESRALIARGRRDLLTEQAEECGGTMDLSRAVWRKSSRSTQNGSCVAVAAIPASGAGAHCVAVRDSKDRSGPVLAFAPDAWAAFTVGVRDGKFDLS